MTAHWRLLDQAAATGNEAELRAAFAEAYRLLYKRISIFIGPPMVSFDKLSLQRKLDRIGSANTAKEDA